MLGSGFRIYFKHLFEMKKKKYSDNLWLNPEVSKSEGRVAQTTNVIIGGTVADDSTNEWIALDKKVYFLFALNYINML